MEAFWGLAHESLETEPLYNFKGLLLTLINVYDNVTRPHPPSNLTSGENMGLSRLEAYNGRVNPFLVRTADIRILSNERVKLLQLQGSPLLSVIS